MTQETVKLKIKIKTLATEAVLNKGEAQKALRSGRWAKAHEEPDQEQYGYGLHNSLYRHRIDVVRPETRATLMAYAFLRGKPCTDHGVTKRTIDFHDNNVAAIKAKAMVTRYGGNQTEFVKWHSDARQVAETLRELSPHFKGATVA